MSYPNDENINGLSFIVLRAANLARLPTFKNCHGDLAHSKSDGSDWSPSQWLQAVVGEIGEYANIRKKFDRGDIDELKFKELAGHELADAITYLDILAAQLGIDLGDVIIKKFNIVSNRVGSNVFIGHYGGDNKMKLLHSQTTAGYYVVRFNAGELRLIQKSLEGTVRVFQNNPVPELLVKLKGDTDSVIKEVATYEKRIE